ncbi:MAG: ABC transporter ATP-binding protein [Longimicrobiales bacterium]
MTTPAVVIDSVSLAFGEKQALLDVSATVQPGEIFGFLGPDGAGKTTLFRVLTTLLVADRGRATVLGLDVEDDLWALRRRVGYMPGRFSLYADLTVEENLRFFATAFGTTIEAQYEIIAPIYRQIEPFRDRVAGALSGGMKQKLALSCALVHRPDILFLDEPTTGVDAVSRREFWDLLSDLKAGGLTIVVSTPYMDEASRCDHVALMQRGSLLATGTPEELVDQYPLPLVEVRGADRYRLLTELRTAPNAHSVFPFGETLHYTDARHDLTSAMAANEVEAFAASRGLTGVSAVAVPPGIEDTFMFLMGGPEGPA